MISHLLPPWLPDWQGASEIAARIDLDHLRTVIHDLLGLVFTEDSVFLDSLPENLESALVSPLNILARVQENGASATELVVASRLVRRSALFYCDEGPGNLKALLEALPV